MTVSATLPTAKPATSSAVNVIELPFEQVTDDFVSRWRDLESRSLEGNAFLSPHFVVPAVKYLEDSYDQKPLVLAVESADSGELLALGLFEEKKNSRLLPLTHLQSWRCEHTLFDGLLVDRSRGQEALRGLFTWLSGQGKRWHGIGFTDRSADAELHQELHAAADAAGASWFEDWSSERAVIQIEEVPEENTLQLYSKSRRRTFRRASKSLEQIGHVQWELCHCQGVCQENVHAFLELESMGWKGDEGTALLSSPNQEQFCREMAAGFAEDRRLVMYELTVDGTPIASSLNMISSNDLFGFKIGWNPKFADSSPGLLNELHFLEDCGRSLPEMRLVDSCSKPGSYVENVWPWKRRLTTGVFTTTMTGTLAASAMLKIKQVKRLLKKA